MTDHSTNKPFSLFAGASKFKCGLSFILFKPVSMHQMGIIFLRNIKMDFIVEYSHALLLYFALVYPALPQYSHIPTAPSLPVHILFKNNPHFYLDPIYNPLFSLPTCP